jgi:hypothetical protein
MGFDKVYYRIHNSLPLSKAITAHTLCVSAILTLFFPTSVRLPLVSELKVFRLSY